MPQQIASHILRHDQPETIKRIGDYRLVHSGDDQEGWYLVVRNVRVDYAIQYRPQTSLPPDVFTQALVWPSRPGTMPRDVATHLLLDVMLPRHHALMSDQVETAWLHEFWTDRVTDAAQRGLRPGVVDVLRHECAWFDSPRGDVVEWLSQRPACQPDRRRALRYLIMER